jgi:hypothetical protein
MRKALLSVFCLLSLGLSDAYGAPLARQGKEPLRSYCKAPEVALFDCQLPVMVASICQKDRQVIFRLGPWWGKPNLEVVSNGHDGRARRKFSRLGSNPNGIGAVAHQHTMRFIWRGVDFIAVVTEQSNPRYESNLVIEKDDVLLSSATCKTTRHPRFDPPNFVDDEPKKNDRVY